MQEVAVTEGKGTYIVILHLPEEKKIEIGQLGKFRFTKGYYAYVGSAFGNGGLQQRISHHINGTEKPHWHIDYLREHAEPVEIWFTESRNNQEHTWAKILTNMPGGNFFLNGFGSSDCKCVSHLYYFGSVPCFQSFKNLLNNNFRRETEIERMLIQEFELR